MIRVIFYKTQNYHGIWHEPYESFLIEEADEVEMTSIGASILERNLYMEISKPVEKIKTKGKAKKYEVKSDN